MSSDSSQNYLFDSSTSSEADMPVALKATKPPRQIFADIFAFAPNKETLGGTAYLIVKSSGNILIDCPVWNPVNEEFLLDKGGVRCLFITHRGGLSKHLQQIQTVFQCEVIIQEQEAYLLPQLSLTSFIEEIAIDDNCYAFWTSGHSPGSACLYLDKYGGILFSGRHLLPITLGEIAPLKVAKTFHWWRQLLSVEKIRNRFSVKSLNYICPGANTGFLRGKGFIDGAYQQLLNLDLESLRHTETLL